MPRTKRVEFLSRRVAPSRARESLEFVDGSAEGERHCAMPRYAALLRAINVGGHIVKMDRLKALFEQLDLANVETFIASGNVLFDTRASVAALTTRIEKHLAAALGYEVKTFLRSAEELASIAEEKPFGEVTVGGDDRVYVGFLERAPGADAKKKIAALEDPANELVLSGAELHWWSREKMSDSKLSGAVFEKTLGMRATFRNRTTVVKLAAKLTSGPAAAKTARPRTMTSGRPKAKANVGSAGARPKRKAPPRT